MAKKTQSQTRWVKVLVWVCVLLLSVGLFFGRQFKARGDIPKILKWLQAPLVIGQQSLKKISRTPGYLGEYFKKQTYLVSSLHQKNERITKLEIQLLEARKSEVELKKTRELLSLEAPVKKKLIFAEVYSKQSIHRFQMFQVDKGTKDKVQVGYPVISPDGVVGRVVRSGLTHAYVLPLIDPNSRLDIINERTGSRSVLVGRGVNQCEYEKKVDADVKVGDRVLTSGLLDFFPAFLPVGKVVSVDLAKDKIRKIIQVKPAVPFPTIRTVGIVRSKTFAVSKGFIKEQSEGML